NGSRVIYVGYLRSPGIDTPIEACKPWGDALEARIDLFSQQSGRLNYLSLQGLVPEGDASYFANDLVHPATKTSQEIARRIAEIIVRTERQ
ncbi:MAG: SGNH/GDSL hydrolase family protein, partial [Pseudomonadota bacterium]|nr:SGNH/GDSL hydrolase family protein [Pseudomonadota bacterium]